MNYATNIIRKKVKSAIVEHICKNCVYFRQGGLSNDNSLKTGHWCSNSKSPFLLTAVVDSNSCQEFEVK